MYRYTYYRLVEKVDKEIGKIIDAIDKNDLWKNTVVIFSSDHGDGIGAHLVVVGKSGSMADFSFLKKKWQNSLDLLTEKVA